MRLVFRPEAEKELLDAQAWYEGLRPGLGDEFAGSVDVAINKLKKMPKAFPQIVGEYQHITTSKFPYSIIYLQTESEIVVVSFFHHRRRPGSWMSNIVYSPK